MISQLLIVILGIAAMNFNCSAQTNKMVKLQADIKQVMARSGGTIAIAFEDLVTGDSLFINEKVPMHAASTMKTPVMIEVFKQAQAGTFSLSDSIVIKNEFKSIVDGSRFSLKFDDDSDDLVYKHIGKKMNLYDLVFQMITVSSNFATNILIDLVSAKNIMKTMESIGARHIKVLRGVEDLKAYEHGLNNTTDAYDMLLILKAIALKKVISAEACDQMINILLNQKFKNKIPARLPATVKVAHKTGSIAGIEHDAAIVYLTPDHPYLLVVLTMGIESPKQAQEAIARISELIYLAQIQ